MKTTIATAMCAALIACSGSVSGDDDDDDTGDCGGCPEGSVCVGGACTEVPDECPCPLETYCDLATNTCVIGCLSHDDCDVGRVCDDATRTCFDGCLMDDECAFGTICEGFACVEGCRSSDGCESDAVCVDGYCQPGCDTSADCDVPGSECVNHSCACPGGEAICGGACTPLDTTADCGGCGIACDAGESCVDDACYCAPAECEPEVLHDAGTAQLGIRLRFDDGHVYFLVIDGDDRDFMRVPKAGGAAELVHATTDDVWGFDVGLDDLVYTAEGFDSSTGRLWRVPLSGGARELLDSGGDWRGTVAVDVSQVYWPVDDGIAAVSLFGGGSSMLVTNVQPSSNFALEPAKGIFWSTHSCLGGICDTSIYRYQGFLDSLYRWDTSQSVGSVTVDPTHVYYAINSAFKTDIFRVPIDGGDPEEVVTDITSPSSLDDDATHLYWRQGSTASPTIYRMPKTGGPIEEFANGISVALDGPYAYMVRGSQVIRLIR